MLAQADACLSTILCGLASLGAMRWELSPRGGEDFIRRTRWDGGGPSSWRTEHVQLCGGGPLVGLGFQGPWGEKGPGYVGGLILGRAGLWGAEPEHGLVSIGHWSGHWLVLPSGLRMGVHKEVVAASG